MTTDFPTRGRCVEWAPIGGYYSRLFWELRGGPLFSALLRSPGTARRSIVEGCGTLLYDLTTIELLTMGWISLRSRLHGPTYFETVPNQATNFDSTTGKVEHVENFDHIHALPSSGHPLQNPSVPDDALPFIAPAIVRNKRLGLPQAQSPAWIVVDNIVYDCTDFIEEHPGGDTVLRSFIGEDCSWQFWRFHSKMIMEEWGRPLRVGRTEGILNRFKEPPRYFGSRNR